MIATIRSRVIQEFKKSPIGSCSAILAAILATIALILSACGQAEANRVARDAYTISKRAEDRVIATTPAAEILSPTQTLSPNTCFRLSGYSRGLQGLLRIWVVVQVEGNSDVYLTEVIPDTPVRESDRLAAVGRSGSAWAAAVAIGDGNIGEPEKTYRVTLYWATTMQSQALRKLLGTPKVTLPADVETQTLGPSSRYTHEPHGVIAAPLPPCKIENAVDR